MYFYSNLKDFSKRFVSNYYQITVKNGSTKMGYNNP